MTPSYYFINLNCWLSLSQGSFLRLEDRSECLVYKCPSFRDNYYHCLKSPYDGHGKSL